MKGILLTTAFVVILPGSVLAQPLILPTLTNRTLIHGLDQGTPTQPAPDSDLFPDVGATFQPFGNSQYGVATKLYAVRVFGFPDCRTKSEQDQNLAPGDGSSEVCTEQVAFTVSVDSQMIHAITNTAAAAREYLVSRKGSPLSVSIPTQYWSTQKPNVRQTWLAAQGYFTARWIPVSGDTTNSSGAVSVGATLELHSDFEAGEVTANDEVMYPGFVYLSISPSLNVPFGKALKEIAFDDVTRDTLWGVDMRAGFSFKGKQPISLSLTATWTPNGFSTSDKSIGISLTKLLSPSTPRKK